MTKQVYAEDCVIEFNDLDANDDSVMTITICEFIENNAEDFQDEATKQNFIDTLLATHRYEYAMFLDSLELRLVSIAFRDTETLEVENISIREYECKKASEFVAYVFENDSVANAQELVKLRECIEMLEAIERKEIAHHARSEARRAS